MLLLIVSVLSVLTVNIANTGICIEQINHKNCSLWAGSSCDALNNGSHCQDPNVLRNSGNQDSTGCLLLSAGQYGSVFTYFPEKTPLSPPLARGEIESDSLPLARGGLGWGSLIEPY